MGKPFGPDNPPPGRKKGSANKLTLFRRELSELLPMAKEQLVIGIQAGDPKMLELYFKLIWTPNRPAYPTLELDLSRPRDVIDTVKTALARGELSSDHVNSILDAVLKFNRIETGLALIDAQVIESTPLETAQTIIETAARAGDLETVMEATKTALPYTTPRPQPEPPPQTGIVSAEPIGLDGDDWEERYRNSTGSTE